MACCLTELYAVWIDSRGPLCDADPTDVRLSVQPSELSFVENDVRITLRVPKP